MISLLADAVADRIETQRRLEFEGLPQGWWAVAGLLLLMAAAAAVIWMYRRETRGGKSLRTRMLLAGLRCLVLLTLAGIWLEPVLATYLTRWVESYCLVLVDDSASMGLQDLYRDPQRSERVGQVLGHPPDAPVRRADLVRRILTNGGNAFLDGLTANNRVKIMTFGDELQTFGTLPADRETHADVPTDVGTSQQLRFDADSFLPAQGSRTDAAMALQRAVQQLSGSPIAGVILVTDGGFTEADAFQSIAAFSRQRGLKLHLVGVGDPAPPRNVRVVDVTAPENAFENDPFQIVAHLSATALEGQTITVNLYESPEDGTADPQRIETRELTIGPDGNLAPLTFSRSRQQKGRWNYRVEVPPGEFESVTDDNVVQTMVSVIDSRIRVLIVSGNPSWEYRYLSRLLTRDETFDVSCWLQSADAEAVRDGNTVIDRLPASAEELFAYDVIVLLDPDPDELDRGWCELVNRLVSDYGGGLLYAAARTYTPSSVHREELGPLIQLLPVRLDPSADLVLNRIGHYQKEPSGLLIADDALTHPAMKMIDDPAGNRLAWQGIGDVYWHYPVAREKPVATVLFRHADPRMANTYGQHVLAATQLVGAGRAAFLAIDGTWRWRKYGEEVFDGFWVRLLRYLVEGKLLGAKKRAIVLTEADSYQLGSTVPVRARVYDRQFNPLRAEQLEAVYRIEGLQRTFQLRPSTEGLGWFEGSFVPDRTGSYEISLQIPGSEADGQTTVRREVRVARPNVEIAQPRMNRDGLVSLAESASGPEGSAYYEIDEAGQIPKRIPDRHEATTVRTRPTPVWDTGWMLTALIALLSAEWAARKWARLL